MRKSRFTEEQIVAILKEGDPRLRKGCSAVACRPANRTRCGLRRLAGRVSLAKGWPARGVGDERTGFRNSATPAAELGTRGGDLGGELSPLGALPRDARFSALVPHGRWRNILASKKRQQLRPLGRNLHRALHSGTRWRVE